MLRYNEIETGRLQGTPEAHIMFMCQRSWMESQRTCGYLSFKGGDSDSQWRALLIIKFEKLVKNN